MLRYLPLAGRSSLPVLSLTASRRPYQGTRSGGLALCLPVTGYLVLVRCSPRERQQKRLGHSPQALTGWRMRVSLSGCRLVVGHSLLSASLGDCLVPVPDARAIIRNPYGFVKPISALIQSFLPTLQAGVFRGSEAPV